MFTLWLFIIAMEAMAHLQMMFPLKAPFINIYGFSSKQFWHNQMVDPKFDQNLLGFQPPHLTVTQTPDGSIVRRWSRRESRSWWRTTSATSKRWGPKRLMPLMPHLLDQYAWIWPKSLSCYQARAKMVAPKKWWPAQKKNDCQTWESFRKWRTFPVKYFHLFVYILYIHCV